MKGLIAEGDEAIKASGDPNVRDAALIAAAQRVEHYEIAGYGTVRTLAQHLGHEEAARILQQTLDEEGACDKKLTQIAESLDQRQGRGQGLRRVGHSGDAGHGVRGPERRLASRISLQIPSIRPVESPWRCTPETPIRSSRLR